MNIFFRLSLSVLLISSIGVSQKLNRTEKKIRTYIEKQNDNAIELIERVVNINSGSLNIDGNKEVGKIFQKELDKLGFKTYWVTYHDSVKRAGHLFAEMRGGKGKKLIMIGHLDTVFEIDHPFQ